MHITLKQVHVFTAVANCESLTLAAERLFLSKAAVSMALSEFEKIMGKRLFDRINNRLVINSEGRQLLPLAQELIERGQSIEHLFRSTSGLYGKLNIAASNTIGNQLLPALLSGFRSQTGHLEQSLFIANTQKVCAKLAQFEADVALVEGEVDDANFIKQAWLEDSMCIIAANDDSLATKANLKYSDFDNSNWLLREPGSGSREYFIKSMAPNFANWHEVFQLGTTEAIINSVSAGLGYACLSEHSARQAISANGVTKLPLELPVKRQFWLVTHKNKYVNPLLEAFINHCETWSPPRIN